MHVSRLIHLCAMLGASPLAMLYAAAPHLWGEAAKESAMRFRMMNVIENLSLETIEPVAAVLEKLTELEKAAQSGQASKAQRQRHSQQWMFAQDETRNDDGS